MSIRIRPWGSTNPDDELDVTETGLPQDTSALVAGGYEVGRIAWEGVQRTIPVPALSSATDAADGSTASTGSVNTTIGDGTLYWVITQSATSPSIAQVKAGQNHTGAAADDSGSQAVSATGVQNMAGSGLTGSTTYYTHFMHEDAAANQSTVASADGFTTAAAATAPAAFTSGQWTSATGSGASEIDIGITTLPSDGGSAITALQYSVDNGSTWTNLTGTGTGSRTIDQHSDGTTGTLTAATSYNVKVRAVNAVGNGADSDTKATTTGAAAGLNFVDDFTSYTIGQTLDAQTPYSAPGGFSNLYIRDASGTRVARQEGGFQVLTYIAQTVADDREVTLRVHDPSIGAGGYHKVYLSYGDASNYVYFQASSDGYWKIGKMVSGTSTTLYDSNPVSTPVQGDDIKIRLSGTTLTCWKNSTQVGSSYTLTSTPLSAPGLELRDVGTDPSISLFTVVEL